MSVIRNKVSKEKEPTKAGMIFSLFCFVALGAPAEGLPTVAEAVAAAVNFICGASPQKLKNSCKKRSGKFSARRKNHTKAVSFTV